MQAQDEGCWELIGMVISFFLVGFEIDEGIREDLARSVSSAWIGLHPKQTKACTKANSAEGKRCVFSNERVQGQQYCYGSTPGFFLHLKSDTSQVHVLNI